MLFSLLKYLYIKYALPPFPSKDLLKTLTENEYKSLKKIEEDNLIFINGYSCPDIALYNLRNRHLNRLFEIGLDEASALRDLPSLLRNLDFPSLKELVFSYDKSTSANLPLTPDLLRERIAKKIIKVPLDHSLSFNLFQAVKSILNIIANSEETWTESAKSDIFKIILRFGNSFFLNQLIDDFDLDKIWQNNNSVLHFAAENTDSDITKILLNKNIKTHLINSQQHTALHIAALRANLPVFDLLYDCSKDFNEERKTNLLNCAAESGNLDIVQKVISLEPKPFHKLHMYAAKSGSPQIYDLLIEKYQLDTNLLSSEGQNALHFAVISYKFTMVKHLVDKGFDVNEQDNKLFTPLHFILEKNKERLKREEETWARDFKNDEIKKIIKFLIMKENDTSILTQKVDEKKVRLIITMDKHLELSELPEVRTRMHVIDGLYCANDPSQSCRQSVIILSWFAAGIAAVLYLIAALTYFYPKAISSSDKDHKETAEGLAIVGSVAASLFLIRLLLKLPLRCFRSPELFSNRISFFSNSPMRNPIELAQPPLEEESTPIAHV